MAPEAARLLEALAPVAGDNVCLLTSLQLRVGIARLSALAQHRTALPTEAEATSAWQRVSLILSRLCAAIRVWTQRPIPDTAAIVTTVAPQEFA